MKLKLLFLFMFPVFAFAQTSSVTMLFRSLNPQINALDSIQYNWAGKVGGPGWFWNAQTIRSYIKTKAVDSTTIANLLKTKVDTGKRDFILIGGQSNMLAIGDSTTAITAYPNTADGYWNGAFRIIKTNVGGGNGSPFTAFAARYYQLTGRKPFFVVTAVTGSSLLGVNDTGAGYWDTGGTLFDRSIRILDTAKIALANHHRYYNQISILWGQGEQDANNVYNNVAGSSPAQYTTALQSLISKFRDSIGVKTPFYISRLGKRAGLPDRWVTIRQIQESVATADPFSKVVFRNAADFAARGLLQPDGTHYTQAGYNEMGLIMAQELLQGKKETNVFEQTAKVGIGTNEPVTTLHVFSTDATNSSVRAQTGIDIPSTVNRYSFKNSSTNFLISDSTNTGILYIGPTTSDPVSRLDMAAPRYSLSLNSNQGVGFGVSTPTTINASNALFPSVIPRFEFNGIQSTSTAYSQLMVLRNPASSSVVTRRLGYMLNLSSESSVGESNKNGGMILESSLANANTPDLYFVTANTKRLNISNAGAISIPAFSTAGVVHNVVTTGVLSSSLIATADITNNAVTYGKMQAVTTNRLLGSGSGAAVSEITLGTGLSFTGTTLNAASGISEVMTTLGDMDYYTGSLRARLPGNTTTAMKFITSTGNGTVSAAPSYYDLFNVANVWSVGQQFNGGLVSKLFGLSVTDATGAFTTTLIQQGTPSSNKLVQIRDQAGVMALTSDLPIAGSFSGVGTATTTFTVTIGSAQPNNTYKTLVTPTSSLSAALFYVTNKTTTTFDVVYLAGLTGTVTFDWSVLQ